MAAPSAQLSSPAKRIHFHAIGSPRSTLEFSEKLQFLLQSCNSSFSAPHAPGAVLFSSPFFTAPVDVAVRLNSRAPKFRQDDSRVGGYRGAPAAGRENQSSMKINHFRGATERSHSVTRLPITNSSGKLDLSDFLPSRAREKKKDLPCET